eukprot:383393_1
MLCFFSLIVLIISVRCTPPYIVPAYPSIFNETVTILTLQGIVNRYKFNLWMNASSTSPGFNVPVMVQFPQADIYWTQYIEQKQNISFTVLPNNNLCTIINPFRNYINGLLQYNTSLDANVYIAATISGLNDYLPVTKTMIDKYQCLKTWFNNNISYLPAFNDSLSLYDWAIDNYLPLTSKQVAINVCHASSFTPCSDPLAMSSIDFGISMKSFIMNLSPDKQNYPSQVQRFNNVIKHLSPFGMVSGWANPEWDFVQRVSAMGVVILDGAPNLSFFKINKTENCSNVVSKPLPYNRFQTKLDKTKYYIVFQTNEGDTAKNAYSLRGGNWVNKLRGTYPIAWGVDPLIAEWFPLLWQYYIDYGTKNDTFFNSVAGAGYTFPWPVMPKQYMINYFNQSGILSNKWMPGHHGQVDIWPGGGGINKTDYELYENYSNHAISAFSQQPTSSDNNGNAINMWLDNGTPLFLSQGGNRSTVSLWYPELNEKDPIGDLKKRIENVAMNNKPPFFILIYGCPQYVQYQYEVAQLLNDDFIMIGAQDMCALGIDARHK